MVSDGASPVRHINVDIIIVEEFATTALQPACSGESPSPFRRPAFGEGRTGRHARVPATRAEGIASKLLDSSPPWSPEPPLPSASCKAPAQGACCSPGVMWFRRVCQALRVPAAAAQDWEAISGLPCACFVLFFTGAVLQAALMWLTFVYASPGILHRHVLAYVWAGEWVFLTCGVWATGPHFLQRYAKPAPIFFALTFCPLAASGLLSFGSSNVPFQSELLYIIMLSVHAFIIFLGCISILPNDQDLLKEMTVGGMVWIALLRTGRFVDGYSDVGFAINLVFEAMECSASSAICNTMCILAAVAGLLAAIDYTFAVALLFLGKAFQERQDLFARRALLGMHCASACCEVGMICVHIVVSFYLVNTSALEHGTDMATFVAFSATTTAVSLFGNLVGARRLVKLLRVVAISVPTHAKAALSHARSSISNARASMSNARHSVASATVGLARRLSILGSPERRDPIHGEFAADSEPTQSAGVQTLQRRSSTFWEGLTQGQLGALTDAPSMQARPSQEEDSLRSPRASVRISIGEPGPIVVEGVSEATSANLVNSLD